MSRPTHTGTALVFAALMAASLPCAADIWGYVDENGAVHISDHQVNERYFLFKKEQPKSSEPERARMPEHQSSFGAGQINTANRALYAPLIEKTAAEFQLDPALMHAVITVESGYNPQAVSPKGATGLMQLMPDTARRYGVKNIFDPQENLQGGARYLRFLLDMFKNNLDLTLAAYNAGEKAVVQYGMNIPPFAETRAYVPSVLLHYERNRGGAPLSGVVRALGSRERLLLIR
jgi:soluble lytic murein transglycosylase-like protein